MKPSLYRRGFRETAALVPFALASGRQTQRRASSPARGRGLTRHEQSSSIAAFVTDINVRQPSDRRAGS